MAAAYACGRDVSSSMRCVLLGCVLLSACSSEDASAFLVAVRTVDGDWHVTEPACGTSIQTPATEPYELVIVEHGSWGASVRSLRTAPDDRGTYVPLWSYGTSLPCRETPDEVYVPLETVGASIATLAIGPASQQIHRPEDSVSFPLGIGDVVAISDEPTPRYVIKRGFELTQDGITIDFNADGSPLQRRALMVEPAGESYTVTTRLTTSGGTTHRGEQGENPGEIWAIPEAVLVEGDRQVASVGATHIDLRAAGPTEPLTVTAAVPIDDAEVVVEGPDVSIQVNTAASWNEFSAIMREPQDSFPVTWSIEHRRSWPGTELRFPDVASIPGWQAAWNLTPHWFEASLDLCERGDVYTRCAGWQR
jgi:hypothetical protein